MRSANKQRYFDKDSPRREKIRLIFFPFLLLTISVIVLYSLLYWYLEYEKGLGDLRFAVVLVSCLAPYFILRRMNLIERDSEPMNRLLFLICGMSMLIPLLCIQSHIDKNVGKFTHLDDISQIGSHPPTRFYTVKNLVFTNGEIKTFSYVKSAGSRSSQQKLDTYCIAPVYSYSLPVYNVWFGQIYKSRPFHPEQEQEVLNSFAYASRKRFAEEVRMPFQYLERITLGEKNGYYRALGIRNKKPQELIVLVPHYKSFEGYSGSSLYYALLAWIIGAGLFLIIVTASPFNEKRLHCFITGERYRAVVNHPPSKIVKGKKVANDKLIVVRGITRQKLENDLKEASDMYNSDGGKMYPSLQMSGDGEFVVTFPYDIDFAPFCYLINFLCYPVVGANRAEVTGWTKAVAGDPWITKLIAGKGLMLYVPDEDKEYDNVYVTTEDGVCYKFGFNGETQSVPKPCLPYRKPEKMEMEE